MADVTINKFRASVVRDGSKPASPGFIVSEGQDPVNPPGTNNYVPYSGATANVELGEYGVEAGFITLDTTPTNIPTDQGAIYWDDTRSTAALIMNGTLQHIGQDSFFYVKNSSGSTIPKGTCVGFAGTDGGSGHLLVTPFLANGSVPSTYFMGVTAEAIANGSFGQVMHFGELEGINTSGFTAGALLYASSTVAGAFQTTAPVAPNNIILVAAAVNSKNNGAIVVRPTYGSNINTDEGVKITSPTTGDLLQLQAGGLWENKTLAQVIGSAYVPSTRTITINGTTQDLSADRTFNVGDMLLGDIQTVTARKDFNSNTLQLVVNGTSQKTILTNSPIDTGSYSLAINAFGFNASNNLYFSKGGNNNGIFAFSNSATRTYTLKDASGTLAFTSDIPSLSGYVQGSGTTNYLPKFTGASTIGNSQIFDNGTNVGIGTASPNSILELSTTTPVLRIQASSNSDFHGLEFRQGAGLDATIKQLPISGEFRISNGRTTGWGGFTTFYIDTAEAARLTPSRNLLVGTTTDNGARLQVSGAATISSTVSAGSHITGTCTTSFNGEGFRAVASATGAAGSQPGIGYWTAAGSKRFINQLDVSSDTWAVTGATGTNYLLITQSGAATFSSSVTSASATINSGTGNNFINFIQNGTNIGFVGDANWIFGGSIQDFGIRATNNLVFGTSFNERMRITSGGNVLIGTTTDNGVGKLQVNGNITVAGTVRFSASGADANRWSVYWNGGTGDLIVVNNISDIRAKKDFDYDIKGLETIQKLKPLKFTWKDGTSHSTSVSGRLRQYGFIAQETMQADDFLAWHNESHDTWGIEQYESFAAVMVKAIQELKQEIDTLKN